MDTKANIRLEWVKSWFFLKMRTASWFAAQYIKGDDRVLAKTYMLMDYQTKQTSIVPFILVGSKQDGLPYFRVTCLSTFTERNTLNKLNIEYSYSKKSSLRSPIQPILLRKLCNHFKTTPLFPPISHGYMGINIFEVMVIMAISPLGEKDLWSVFWQCFNRYSSASFISLDWNTAPMWHYRHMQLNRCIKWFPEMKW